MNKITKLAFAALFFPVVAVLPAFGTGATSTIEWSAQNSKFLGDLSSNPLAAGDLVLLGNFNLTDAQIKANSGNISFLQANFSTYDSVQIAVGTSIVGSWDKLITSPTGSLGNKSMYIWAFNAVSAASATQQAIVTSSAWTFPTDSTNYVQVNIDLQDANDIILGTASTLNIPTVGSASGINTAAIPTGGAIPEPSTYAMFGGIAVLGFAAWRRRRAS